MASLMGRGLRATRPRWETFIPNYFFSNFVAETTNVKTAPTGEYHSQIDWSQTMDQFFVELMLDQVHKGNETGHTFNKKAWAGMVTSFNTKFGFHCGRVALKNWYNIDLEEALQ